MYVKKYSIKNQQKLTVGLLENGFYKTFKWFHNFDKKEGTIMKIELSDMDIEKIFKGELFYKGELTNINNVSYKELNLIDILDLNIFIPDNLRNRVFNHPILLKRKLDYDTLHNVIYCFKGTFKAIETLLKINKLSWTTKAQRSKEENNIIWRMKHNHNPDYYELGQRLYILEDYEVIESIYDIEIMESLINDFQIICKKNKDYQYILDMLESRYTEFNESKDMDSLTYIEDY